ncbi:MAG: hypothetical protein LUD48_03145, partial [Prevotella sp.]|nr:hypothetical protein [Prevotella sp.]
SVNDSINESSVCVDDEMSGVYPDNAETVISYKDVFRAYYNQAEERMNEGNIEIPYSFDEFCDGYYMFDMDIQEYTDFLVDEAYGYIDVSEYVRDSQISTLASSSSSSVADYILKFDASPTNEPDIIPNDYFREMPSTGIFDLSGIMEGDIIRNQYGFT